MERALKTQVIMIATHRAGVKRQSVDLSKGAHALGHCTGTDYKSGQWSGERHRHREGFGVGSFFIFPTCIVS